MPRFPAVEPVVASLAGSVYSRLADRMKEYRGTTYPLHVGDTWLEPAVGCRMEDIRVADHPGMHRYAHPMGTPSLRTAIARQVSARSGVETGPDEVLVGAGATGALGAVVRTILAPGEEVLIAAPFWPLIHGIVLSAYGRPVPVDLLGAASGEEIVRRFEAELRPTTAAVYVCSPSNPTGIVWPADWVAAVADWARHHDLWILADEVYEDYDYSGRHTYFRPLARERTFSCHSFSKAYGMAGNRCGWVVGPTAAIDQVRKVSTHTFYSTPTAAQIAAERALKDGAPWIAEARQLYETAGRSAASRLGVPAPGGGTFLFLDVREFLDGEGLDGFLLRCADQGLFLAPGPSFGPYPTFVRVCFTAAPPERVAAGIEILAQLMGR